MERAALKEHNEIVDLAPIVDEIIDCLIECGIDTYDEYRYMIMSHCAFYGQVHILKLWDKVFTRADQRRPLLLEMH